MLLHAPDGGMVSSSRSNVPSGPIAVTVRENVTTADVRGAASARATRRARENCMALEARENVRCQATRSECGRMTHHDDD